MTNKAIFLDRDGTINVEKGYLYKIEDFEFLPGSVQALKLLQDAGYLLIILTNQSGIARGYYKEEDFLTLNNWMLKTLEEKDIHIAKVYFCPHHPEADIAAYRLDCECRKPKLGMFRQAVNDFDLNLDSCFAVGDKIRDCCICKTSGCHGFLIGNNEEPDIIKKAQARELKNVSYAESLLGAAKKIVWEV